MQNVDDEYLEEVLKHYSGNTASVPIFDCSYGSLNFRNIFFGSRGVHNEISIISSIVVSNSMSMRTVCIIMLLMVQIFITHF